MSAKEARVRPDSRRFIVIDRDGDYFAGFESKPWETVKRYAHWTKDRKKASVLVEGDGQMPELICGFSGLRTETIKQGKQ